ncbi:hypothetical protein [Vibrio sp. M260112]|uniref:hypothetical protein n=1 Tax=Vibrio sp. M260112 TaxID=3020895 RepID=UPI002F407DE4
MKKNILEINNILATLKLLTPVHDRDYVRRIWAITNHVAIQASKGRDTETEIMTDLQQFINLLNEKYPVRHDDKEALESNLGV